MNSSLDIKTQALQSTRTFTATATILSAITVLAWNNVGVAQLWPWLLVLAIVTCFAIFTFLCRTLPLIVSVLMVLLGSAAIFGAGSYTVNTLAASGVNFEAFAAYKIMAIAVAIIAPYPIWLGYFIILLSGTLPLLHFFMLPTELHRFFSIQEPWYSLLYAVLGLIILIYRHKSLRLEQRMARIAAEKNALSELAAILLMLRDLTNTPLQSLEITSYLLKEGQMNPKEGSAHLERALVRLRELTRELSLYGHHVDWSQTGASFDAIKRLRQHYSKFTLEHETAD